MHGACMVHAWCMHGAASRGEAAAPSGHMGISSTLAVWCTCATAQPTAVTPARQCRSGRAPYQPLQCLVAHEGQVLADGLQRAVDDTKVVAEGERSGAGNANGSQDGA